MLASTRSARFNVAMLEAAPTLTTEQQINKAKHLARVMLAANTELSSLPREVLVVAASQGIVRYHQQSTIWGNDSKYLVEIIREKDYRFSLLTDDEQRQAMMQAHDWLDDHFSL